MSNISTLGYVNSEKLVKWVIVFICLQIIMAFAGMISSYMQFSLLQNYADLPDAAAKMAGDRNDLRQAAVFWIQAVVYFLTAMVILKWIYRANYNARELGATNMTFSPIMSVVWFFVPIFGLWKPYQAMVQIWKASSEPVNWKSAKGHPVIATWWAFWLGTVFIGFFSLVMANRASDISSTMDASLMEMLSDLFTVFSTLAMLMLVMRIHETQMRYIKEN